MKRYSASETYNFKEPTSRRHPIWKSLQCLFCRIPSRLQGSFAKETYNLKEPTSRSHPICQTTHPHGDDGYCVLHSLHSPSRSLPSQVEGRVKTVLHSLHSPSQVQGRVKTVRVVKTHRIPYLYRSFSTKVTYIEWLFCGKWSAT